METGPSALIFLKLSIFIILTYGVLDFISRKGSFNSFGQVVPEILLNNYLESNLENPEIRFFVLTFWFFMRRKSSPKNHLFFELYMQISPGSLMIKRYMSPFWNPLIKEFHMKVVWSFWYQVYKKAWHLYHE